MIPEQTQVIGTKYSIKHIQNQNEIETENKP
jgi:hypothetical protein